MIKKTLKILLVAAATVTTVSTSAAAETTEVGLTDPAIQPTCTADNCVAIPKTTGFQYRIGNQKDVMVIPRDGKIVAWTIRLAKLNSSQTSFFQSRFGAEPQARISILRKLKDKRIKGSKRKQRQRYIVTGQSPVINLTPYLGVTAQFPLERTLTVRKGYVVALTIPTWVPALSVGADSKHAWRSSRQKKKCDENDSKSDLDFGKIGRFECLYRTSTMTYSATLISTP